MNADLVRQAYDAFNRRDIAAVQDLMDAEGVAISRLAAIEGGYRGHEGLRRWWQDLLEAWPDYTVEVVEVRDVGDATLVHAKVGGRAADSGIRLWQTSWHVWRWRDGKAIWFAVFTSEAEALAAIGE
jgi:ketosteroid isomerase-like protein